MEYAADEVMDKEFNREGIFEKMILLFRSARLDVPAAVSHFGKTWRNERGAILRAIANPRYSLRAVPLLSAMTESKDHMVVDAAVPYLARIHTSASARVLTRLLKNPTFRASAVRAQVPNGSRPSQRVLLGFFKDRRSDSLARFALVGILDLNTRSVPGIVEYALATEAASTGNPDILKKLVDNGADPKLKGPS